MLGTLVRRATIKTLDLVVERGRTSGHAPVRAVATAIDRARGLVGLERVQREVPLPTWEGRHPERPMWESDRKKLRKFQVEHGIVEDDAGEGDAARETTTTDKPAVKIYYKRGCPYARAALDLLREREIAFEEVDFKGDEATASWLKIVTGRQTSPQIFVHDQAIGGYDELRALDLAGELLARIERGPTEEAATEQATTEASAEIEGTGSGGVDEIEVTELRERIDEGVAVLLLDVRTAREIEGGMLEHAMHVPLAELAERYEELDREGVWIAYCKSGQRSRGAVRQLAQLGFRSVVSLRGGIDAWTGEGGSTVAPGQTEPRKAAVKRPRRAHLPVLGGGFEQSPFEGLGDDWEGDTAERLEDEALVERVVAVLDECRPLVQADGGDIELLDVRDDVVHVRLTGNCVGCPSSQATLRQGIERRLQTRIPQIKGIASPQLQPVG
jgi:Fe-S cluster biogenesis protein NfuA/rhodanese-related sulfurtransferase/glutaredoxin